ncbi:hypothetical protein BGX29_005722 [Mortierella sp. GBA35]|nr:hypothetical protein BGX29_005722 [Mortierella sp. GBA35]
MTAEQRTDEIQQKRKDKRARQISLQQELTSAHNVRSYVFQLLEQVVVGMYYRAEVYMMGSYMNKIYVASSDLNLTVTLWMDRSHKTLTRITKSLSTLRIGTNNHTVYRRDSAPQIPESLHGYAIGIALDQVREVATLVTAVTTKRTIIQVK